MAKLDFLIPDCDGSEYVLFPACCYNGNKFRVKKGIVYPPMFTPDEVSPDMEITITDVPRLNKDGSGKIEVTTGDVSTPCVAVWNKQTKQATFIYTVQKIAGKNIGLAYEQGKITLTWPAHRNLIYHMMSLTKNETPQPNVADEGEIPHKQFTFDCNSLNAFFAFYFSHRKCMELPDERAEVLPFERQFEIQRDKFNAMNWTGRFYDLDTRGQWQPGWCGGAISSYPLMKLGGALEKERAISTLDYLFDNQAPTGLFYGFSDKKNDGFSTPGTENWVLIRKSADVLYFLFKHFALMDEIPEKFLKGTEKLADFFVRLWKENGRLGQFIDCISGEIVAGNSTSGAIVPAALTGAYCFFKKEEYLEVAKESARFMFLRDAKNGYTTGGPGEILQGPDSESAFALLESMVCLYETTGEKEWLEYAEYMARFCSSWVVSYNYRFPEKCEFNRLQMKTVGSVFANVQNKHSAPAICTLSGCSLNKLYRWTGNKAYKELYDDITLSISQYMSTDERPIYSWDHPISPSERLPQGFINERVNLSDWETDICVGGVFPGSCWCEVSNLLFLAERE